MRDAMSKAEADIATSMRAIDVAAALHALADLLAGERPLKPATADGVAVMIQLCARRLDPVFEHAAPGQD